MLQRARTAVRRGWRRSIALWRRSLKLRVVTTTVASSLVAILLLGNVLVTQVRDGLLDDRRQASLAEASTGLRTAQEAFDSADRSEPGVYDTLVPDLVRQLARGGGSEGTKDVVLLRGPDINSPEAPLGRSSSGADITALDTLRPQVQARSSQLWTYAAVQRDSGRRVPVIVVGAPVQVPSIGAYELYYIFPLDKEQDTLGLVRRALLVGALGLVVLVGGIAWLVTRQVVTPVRMAARIAERLSAGRLEERMRVRGEDDLARLAASFNRMATSLQRQIRQLEDLSRVQRRFVSDVSHELRTPLTTVRMAADVLHEARAGFDPAVERSAEILQAQLDRFESLLADLLEISRYDAGAAMLEAEPTDIVSVARQVVEAMEPLADRRGSLLALVSPPGGAVAEVDSRRIERVLRNLVVNAIEHGEGRPVTVIVAADDRAVAVAVRDRGVGPPEAVEHHGHVGGGEAHSVVAHRDRHRVVVGTQQDHDRPSLAVLDRVDDQVAKDPLDPSPVDLGQCPAGGCVDAQLAAAPVGERLHRLDHVLGDADDVGRLGVEDRRPGVVAADLEQVAQQGLEAVQLGLQDLRAALDGRVEADPRLVQHVGRHPDRGERGPQLVRHVGDEASLHPGEVLQLADLALQTGGHPVEGRRQPSKVVLPADPHPLLEPADSARRLRPVQVGVPYRRTATAGQVGGGVDV